MRKVGSLVGSLSWYSLLGLGQLSLPLGDEMQLDKFALPVRRQDAPLCVECLVPDWGIDESEPSWRQYGEWAGKAHYE